LPLKKLPVRTIKCKIEIPMKILIAEDDLMNQILIKMYMNDSGYEYVLVKNGYLAVEACKNEDFDIILMDLKMPVLDGVEATKQIRLFNKSVPIVAISAHSEAQNGIACALAGINAYVEKPFTLEEIQHVITHFTGIMLKT
jgi:CheY-like chemotaxis protein